jgi:hypothetical protein
MALYRIYVDEVGNHDMTHVDDPNERFLALTGVILECGYTLNVLQPEVEQLKRRFFPHDPDDPIIFHRKELVNKRPPFQALRDSSVEQEFNDALLNALTRWDYRVITIVIDKKAHRDQYVVWRYHPYHYCLSVMLERFVLFLHYNGQRGDVLVESRGKNEDSKLKDSFHQLYMNGTDHIPVQRWQQCLTSGSLKVKHKDSNSAGLQLADLLAHPSRREILISKGLIANDRNTFGDQIASILLRDKYHRNARSGQVDGYGRKVLP